MPIIPEIRPIHAPAISAGINGSSFFNEVTDKLFMMTILKTEISRHIPRIILYTGSSSVIFAPMNENGTDNITNGINKFILK